jgi:hypothetical protein
MTTPSTEPYPFIRADGRMLGSCAAYIDMQIELARADNAPAHAIYPDRDGVWQTTDDVVSVDARQALGLDPLPPIPVTVTALVEDIAARLRFSSWPRDRHGLADVRPDGAALTLTFTTGHTGIIRFDVTDPDTTG